jgi:hypothetical protein
MNYLSDKIRLQVWLRASNCCEYCYLHRDSAFFTHEIDHIISLKHNGQDILVNLALACYYCNRYKGTDIGSIYMGEFIRFFNPRIDNWHEHFEMDLPTATIQPLSPIGEVTATILGFNQVDRIIERQILIASNQYPPDFFYKK